MADERRTAGAKKPDRPWASDDDLPIVDRVLAGDTQGFEELVRRHERRVYRTVLAITGNAEDAEDAMQETFLNAYEHLGQFHREARFATWLTRIAINEGLQKLRKRKNMESLDEPVGFDDEMMPRQIEDWHDNPEQLCAQQEIRQFVEEAIQSLPPTYRVAFVLRDVQGLSTEEAAEALSLSVSALKSRILRARLMMRETLASRFQRPLSTGARIRRAGQMLSEAFATRFRRRPTERREK